MYDTDLRCNVQQAEYLNDAVKGMMMVLLREVELLKRQLT